MCVLEQIRLATYGVESHVSSLQTNTGVKDKIAQHWIEILISKSREMQSANPEKCKNTISDELLAWLGMQTDLPYNPLLDVECTAVFSISTFGVLHFDCRSSGSLSGYLGRDSSHHSPGH